MLSKFTLLVKMMVGSSLLIPIDSFGDTFTVLSLFRTEGTSFYYSKSKPLLAKNISITESARDNLEKYLEEKVSVEISKIYEFSVIDFKEELPRQTLRRFLPPLNSEGFSQPLLDYLVKWRKNKSDYLLLIVPGLGAKRFLNSHLYASPGGVGMIYIGSEIFSVLSYRLLVIDLKLSKIVKTTNIFSETKFDISRPLKLKERESLLKLINKSIRKYSKKYVLSDIPSDRILTEADIQYLVSRNSDLFGDRVFNPTHHSLGEFDSLSEKDFSYFQQTVKKNVDSSVGMGVHSLMPLIDEL